MPESPDRRINWSVLVLFTVPFVFIAGALAPLSLVPALAGGRWFWIALILGGVTALIFNLSRPKYESAKGKWRSFYDFLLRQMPPPD